MLNCTKPSIDSMTGGIIVLKGVQYQTEHEDESVVTRTDPKCIIEKSIWCPILLIFSVMSHAGRCTSVIITTFDVPFHILPYPLEFTSSIVNKHLLIIY